MANDDWDDDEIESAGTSSSVDYNDILGHLILVKVLEVEDTIPTADYGDAQNVPRVNLVDIDTGTEYEDVLMFGTVLSNQLRRKVGKQVAGKFAQGEKQKGKSAPWQIEPMTEDDRAKITAWKASKVSGTKPAGDKKAPPF